MDKGAFRLLDQDFPFAKFVDTFCRNHLHDSFNCDDLWLDYSHHGFRKSFYLDDPRFMVHFVLLSNALDKEVGFFGFVTKGYEDLVSGIAEWSVS